MSIGFGDVFRLQFADSRSALLFEFLVSQIGFQFVAGELAQRPCTMDADFAGAKCLDQLQRPRRIKYLLYLGHIAGGYARKLGNQLAAIDSPIFRQF